MILLRPLCWLLGHKRGKFVSATDVHKRFACPRCGRETSYKVQRPMAQTSPADGSDRYDYDRSQPR